MFPRQESKALEIGAGMSFELALMADLLGELENLAKRARDRGVDAAVLSRFSVDPTADLLEQIEGLDPDVLLIRSDSLVADQRSLADVPVTVATFEGGPVPAGAPLSVLARNGQSGDSALALAVRLARGRSAALQVVDDGRRRLGTLLERFGKVGVDAAAAEGVLAGVAVLAAEGSPPVGAEAVLRVRAHAQQDDSELVLLLEALPVQTRREPGGTPVGSV
jgi:hypothetical protein